MRMIEGSRAGEDHMKFVAGKMAIWFARHHDIFKQEPLRYLDYLSDALFDVEVSMSLPEVLARLVPGLSQSCALELMAMKFHGFAGDGINATPVVQSAC